MRFGIFLRELSRLRVGVAVSVLVAALAAVWSVADISLFPPRLHSRSLQLATAYTQVMVDTPYSAVFDLRQNTDDIKTLANRAVLVGSLMGTPPLAADIAHSAGLPADAPQIQAPRTLEQPRVSAVPGRSNGPSDLLRSTAQYRLDIEVDPIVPFLDIYAQAPTAGAAAQLANGAVDGLGSYLRGMAATERTPQAKQVQLRQFGRARGKVINGGVQLQVALLTFLFVFVGGCAVAVAVARVRRGWALTRRPSPGGPVAWS
jgi:hypothetical protein